MQQNGKARIIIATHKAYWMPEDPIYLPLHVGAAGKLTAEGTPLDLGYVRDDTGDNISSRNKNYCELTGLYWAWKNLEADHIGLAHYRRHFTVRRGRDKKALPLTGDELRELLKKDDIILPKQRNYYIETNYDQYAHAHHGIDLDTAREILRERYPACLPAFDASMKRTYGHRFNMFIMRRDHLDAWCTWLFDVLFELERRLDISSYSANDARVFGFVSERLLDVWIETERLPYRDIPYVFMEDQNWLTKGGNFLRRKFLGKTGARP
ncbi:MAG: DUF4422 domain-containing protein [Clostridia bacterium]|nr:DUF4422 domain-containing protein [Clostridia bacterium]